MKKIITIVKKNGYDGEEIRCDIEVPTDVKTAVLTNDIVQALEGYYDRPITFGNGTGLYLCRREQMLDPHKTFEENDVRNGDIIQITENGHGRDNI